MSVQSVTWTETLHQRTGFPMDMRRMLETVIEEISPVEDTRDVKFPEKVIAEVKGHLGAVSYNVERDPIVPGTQFKLDLLIRDQKSLVATEIETGKGARIELDLFKLMAYAKRTDKAPECPVYGWLLISDKYLLRITTGTPTETGFSYVRRVLRLLDLPEAGMRDRLVVQFQTHRI